MERTDYLLFQLNIFLLMGLTPESRGKHGLACLGRIVMI